VEISSFLEELKLQNLLEKPVSLETSDLSRLIFQSLINSEATSSSKAVKITAEFFSFPFNINDIVDKKLNISFYPWERLRYRTFEYYLEDIEKIRKLESELQQDFSPTLIGDIAHEIINLVWSRIMKIHGSRTFKHNFINNTKKYVSEAVDEFLEYNKKFLYQAPHNFSERYFHKIFLPILRSGIENFLYNLHNELNLSDTNISVYSEIGESSALLLFRLEDIDIQITGRPDLRIESGVNRYIFDYKTGKFDSTKTRRYNPQLQFYELLFSDQKKGKDSDTVVKPYLYFIEQKKLEPLSKSIDIESTIIETLKNILEYGYKVNEKKYNYENSKITRRDLLTKRCVE
jgi:hypothetical protein